MLEESRSAMVRSSVLAALYAGKTTMTDIRNRLPSLAAIAATTPGDTDLGQ
jgi:hypothetical protein